MARLRKGKCYTEVRRAYTRIAQRVPKKSYIKGVPGSKIRQFEMGEKRGDYDIEVRLIAKEPVQIRHNALEAARTAATRYIKANAATNEYFMKVVTYPHQVLRENPIAMGAGADRFSQGMRRAFGRPVGFAAVVKPGNKIATIRTILKKEGIMKEALRKAGTKLPLITRIEVFKLK